jgi:hypothetical protein
LEWTWDFLHPPRDALGGDFPTAPEQTAVYETQKKNPMAIMAIHPQGT